MTERESVAARIPVSELDALDAAVRSKHGKLRGKKGQYVQSAMEMFIDESDVFAALDALGDIEDMLADGIDDYSRRRRSLSGTHTPPEWNGETKKQLGVKIDADLKERFKSWVTEETDLTYGNAVARAIREYRQTDPDREVRTTAERIRDELDSLDAFAIDAADGPAKNPADATDESESDDSEDAGEANDTMPYYRDEKIARIKADLAEIYGMTVDELAEAEISRESMAEGADPGLVDLIHKYCAKGDREQATDRVVESYIEEITDDLGLVEHPSGRLFVPDEESDVEPDAPAFERKDHTDLSRSERVEAVRVQLLRKATRNRGATQATAAEIREMFDDELPDQRVHDLRRLASNAEGFKKRTAPDGTKAVAVDIPKVEDEDLLAAAGLVNDKNGSESEDDVVAEAEATMDQLMNAMPDGGRRR